MTDEGEKAAPKPPVDALVAVPQEPTAAVQMPSRRIVASEQLPLPMQNALAAMHSSQFSGPLPPPEMLADYDRVVPGLAREILLAANEERAHRHALDGKEFALVDHMARAQTANARLGMHYALVVTIATFIVAVIALLLKEPTVAIVVAGIDLVGLATVFIVGRKAQRRDEAPEAPEKPTAERKSLRPRQPE